jgi:hypothetical protein
MSPYPEPVEFSPQPPTHFPEGPVQEMIFLYLNFIFGNKKKSQRAKSASKGLGDRSHILSGGRFLR